MKKNIFIIFFIIIFQNILIFFNLYSQINNVIVVKVGETLITSVDIKNEILSNLIINGLDVTQENINNNKNFAVKNLINKSIKRNEVNKFEITDYNKKDLQKYISTVAENLNTDVNGLKEIFKKNNVSFQTFAKKHETELLWNTLIFAIYKNQTNVNIYDVNYEVEQIKEDKSEDELKKIRERILNQKKREKLSLFSRSHFTNLENTIAIDFQ